jgi:hypothetical protein
MIQLLILRFHKGMGNVAEISFSIFVFVKN